MFGYLWCLMSRGCLVLRIEKGLVGKKQWQRVLKPSVAAPAWAGQTLHPDRHSLWAVPPSACLHNCCFLECYFSSFETCTSLKTQLPLLELWGSLQGSLG